MTDRTPPQEREREARTAVLRTWGDPARLGRALDAYAAAVAARVRAELREKVSGMRRPHAFDCTERFGGSCDCRPGLYNDGLDAVLAALSKETTHNG